MPTTISKSKYVAGLQCPKLLWTHYNDAGLIPDPDDARQAIFDTGHEVGELAQTLHPDGVEVEYGRDLAETVRHTRELLPRRIPIFEASFEVDGCYCRADLLIPVGDDAWDLYEVKSATSVKDVNFHDVAFQAHVIERSGVNLDRLYLMHLNSQYERRGPVNPHGLFHASDVTDAARALQPGVAGKAAAMHATIAGPRPETPIGEHCFKPYGCDLWPLCSGHLPEHPVLELNGLRKREAFAMIDAGTPAIVDLPLADFRPKHLIQRRAIETGEPQIMADEIRRFLAGLEYPLHCLDFEAMNPAIPRYDGTRPYQHIAFQHSLHIIDQLGAPPRHLEYLAETPDDPRPGLIDALRVIGPRGTVLAFNTSYEKRIVSELARDFPDQAAFLMDLHGRFRDLAVPFRNFWYYDARQHGSASLKAVLPALTGTTYAGLEIAEGGQAMREYQRAMFGDVDDAERARVLSSLRDYCRQDTQSMVDILEVLGRI